MSSKRIMVAGHVTLDITPAFLNSKKQKFSEIIKPGKLVNVGAAQVSTGGAVSNTGMALKKLGADVILTAKTGADLFGEILRQKIQESGCEAELIVSKEDRTSYSVVLAPVGNDRAFLHDPGSNDTFSCKDMDWEKVKQADYFHFGYPTVMRKFYLEEGTELAKLYKKVKELGLITSLDMASIDPDSEAGSCDWEKILKTVLPYVDFFVPSIEELAYMLDRKRFQSWQKEAGEEDIVSVLSLEKDVISLADKALSFGCGVVLIKCGAAGMYIKAGSKQELQRRGKGFEDWEGTAFFEDSYEPEKILSGTGAGDTSIAAFLKAVMDGYSPKECVQYAAATGACCVGTYDAISGLLPFASLKKKMEDGWKKQKLMKD